MGKTHLYDLLLRYVDLPLNQNAELLSPSSFSHSTSTHSASVLYLNNCCSKEIRAFTSIYIHYNTSCKAP